MNANFKFKQPFPWSRFFNVFYFLIFFFTSSSCRIRPMKKNFPLVMISVGKTFDALLSMKTSAAVPIRKSSVMWGNGKI